MLGSRRTSSTRSLETNGPASAGGDAASASARTESTDLTGVTRSWSVPGRGSMSLRVTRASPSCIAVARPVASRVNRTGMPPESVTNSDSARSVIGVTRSAVSTRRSLPSCSATMRHAAPSPYSPSRPSQRTGGGGGASEAASVTLGARGGDAAVVAPRAQPARARTTASDARVASIRSPRVKRPAPARPRTPRPSARARRRAFRRCCRTTHSRCERRRRALPRRSRSPARQG